LFLLILVVFWPVQFVFDRFGGFTIGFVLFSAGSFLTNLIVFSAYIWVFTKL